MADYKILIGADTSKLVQDIEAVTSKKTYTVKVQADGSSLQTLAKQVDTVATTFDDGTKSTAQFTNSIKEGTTQVDKMATTTKSASNAQKDLKSSTKEVKTVTDNSVKSQKTLGQTLVDNTKKVAQFFVSAQIVQLFYKSITQAYTEVKTLDASLVELRKVTDLGGESLNNYKNEAYDLAEQLKTSATNVTDAVTQFSKSGYSLAESMELAETAIILQTISDDFLKSANSANFLISTMAGFNLTASDTEHIINAVNEVSNNFAISSTDIVENLGKVSAVSDLAGINFEELLGLTN